MSKRDQAEDFVTFMYVPGQAGNIRRYHVRRTHLRRGLVGLCCGFVVFALLSVDYVIARTMGHASTLKALRSPENGSRW